ncbi:MAG: sigma-54-dependent transcriptional regulator [Pirellulaceae bacterium]
MRILVVDSEAAAGSSLARELARQGHDPAIVRDGDEALVRLDGEHYELVFADTQAPKVDGIELLSRIKRRGRGTEVVVMSANGSIPTAIEAVRLGAFDFVAKPLTSAEIAALLAKLKYRRASPRSHAEAGPRRPHARKDSKVQIDRQMVGSSDGIARVKQMIRVSARTDANVLIYGETGVGKDLVAAVIHGECHRNKRPFVKVGCALFPESLIESELYGHEEGSFTGADQHRKGRFERAEGGTIYLDDVDDIPMAQQAKLLRAIEEKVFERVGGSKPIKANVRIVASSKKNLLTKIGDGTFREDLYYRLDVLRIRVPPLRERRADVPVLTEHLLRRIAAEEPFQIDPQAVVLLAQHDWPGNVREMYHTLERTFLLGAGHITADLVDAEMGGPPSPESKADAPNQPGRGGFQSVMRHAEKQLLMSALEACGGNKTAAANSLAMKVSTFRDKLGKHGIT